MSRRIGGPATGGSEARVRAGGRMRRQLWGSGWGRGRGRGNEGGRLGAGSGRRGERGACLGVEDFGGSHGHVLGPPIGEGGAKGRRIWTGVYEAQEPRRGRGCSLAGGKNGRRSYRARRVTWLGFGCLELQTHRTEWIRSAPREAKFPIGHALPALQNVLLLLRCISLRRTELWVESH